MIFLQYGQIDVLDGAFVLIDKTGIRTHIPVGSVACIMLEPGTRVSHAAVHLAATVGTLLVWVGEAGVRVYSSGQPGGARADKLLYQAKLALTEATSSLYVMPYQVSFDFKTLTVILPCCKSSPIYDGIRYSALRGFVFTVVLKNSSKPACN